MRNWSMLLLSATLLTSAPAPAWAIEAPPANQRRSNVPELRLEGFNSNGIFAPGKQGDGNLQVYWSYVSSSGTQYHGVVHRIWSPDMPGTCSGYSTTENNDRSSFLRRFPQRSVLVLQFIPREKFDLTQSLDDAILLQDDVVARTMLHPGAVKLERSNWKFPASVSARYEPFRDALYVFTLDGTDKDLGTFKLP